MFRSLGALALLTVLLAGGPAFAQGSSLQGQTVRGAKGVVLGVVERVIANAAGAPAQILVKPKGVRAGGPRSLSIAGVTVGPEGITTPLTKAEFEAMPPVDVPEH